MKKFKVQVSKNQKKYNLVVQSESIKDARDRVHSEGYSVLEIEEFSDQVGSENKFFFRVKKNGVPKSGTIFGDDPFKVYLKLRKDLGYEVLELYKDEKDSEEKRQQVLKNLEDAFAIYSKNQNKADQKIKKASKKSEKKEANIDDFYLKKELESTHKLIEFVIAKIETVLNSKNLGKIDEERRRKIEQVYQNIIQIKSSTNISKLKEIGELALLRIGQIELEVLEKEKNIYAKEYLKETNKLLKKIGSDKHFIEKDKDIRAIIDKFLKKGKTSLKKWKENRKKNKKIEVDKTSYDYLKSAALLNRYKQRYKELRKEIIKKSYYPFISSKKEEFTRMMLTRGVLRQNIIIMKAKKSGKVYSYTKLVKGYERAFEILHNLLEGLNSYLFAVVAIFSFLFVFFLNFNYFLTTSSEASFNYYGLYGILYLIAFSWLSHFIRGFTSLGISGFVLVFSIIFFGINY